MFSWFDGVLLGGGIGLLVLLARAAALLPHLAQARQKAAARLLPTPRPQAAAAERQARSEATAASADTGSQPDRLAQHA